MTSFIKFFGLDFLTFKSKIYINVRRTFKNVLTYNKEELLLIIRIFLIIYFDKYLELVALSYFTKNETF